MLARVCTVLCRLAREAARGGPSYLRLDQSISQSTRCEFARTMGLQVSWTILSATSYVQTTTLQVVTCPMRAKRGQQVDSCTLPAPLFSRVAGGDQQARPSRAVWSRAQGPVSLQEGQVRSPQCVDMSMWQASACRCKKEATRRHRARQRLSGCL